MKLNFRSIGEQGSAVLVVITLLAIMVVIIASTTLAIKQLGQELNIIEKQQKRKAELRHAGTGPAELQPDGQSIPPVKSDRP